MSATLNITGISLAGTLAVRSAGARRRMVVVAMSVADKSAAATTTAASLYEVLRVKETASAGEIKAAYRALAKRYHPDVAAGTGDGPDFLEIQRAYATLSEPGSRARYDRSRGLPFAGLRRRRWETDQCW